MKKITITKEQTSQRIDKFLVREFFSSPKNASRDKFSRGEIIKAIKEKLVLVNGKAVKPSYVLQEKDALEIKNFEKKNELIANKSIKLDIIFENEDIIVINKPAGIAVHPSPKEKENTVVNALIAKYPKIKGVHDDSFDAWLRPGIVHRLDKDTSGVMVMAKNLKTFAKLKNIFKKRLAQKKYVAICKGTFKNKEGFIEKPIARSSNYRRQVIAGRKTKTIIREAFTEYKVLKNYDGYSSVEVMPKTGRMHQIRIHLASIGHPIVGDSLYTKKHRSKRKDTEIYNVRRQLLHAKELKFSLFGKNYDFFAPIPDDFDKFSN